MESKTCEPGLIGQVDSRDALLYPPREQRFDTLLRGHTHSLAIHRGAGIMGQIQCMEDQCGGFIQCIVSPMAVEHPGATQPASAAADQITDGDAGSALLAAAGAPTVG